jgi:hypothetical protein
MFLAHRPHTPLMAIGKMVVMQSAWTAGQRAIKRAVQTRTCAPMIIMKVAIGLAILVLLFVEMATGHVG